MSAVACRVMESPYGAQALDYLTRMVNVFEGAKAHPIAFHGRVSPYLLLHLCIDLPVDAHSTLGLLNQFTPARRGSPGQIF